MLVFIAMVLFSLGAINALIPILIIITLLVAAAGLNRGYSLFNFFGLATLAGINPGGKASIAGKSGFGFAGAGYLPGSGTHKRIVKSIGESSKRKFLASRPGFFIHTLKVGKVAASLAVSGAASAEGGRVRVSTTIGKRKTASGNTQKTTGATQIRREKDTGSKTKDAFKTWKESTSKKWGKTSFSLFSPTSSLISEHNESMEFIKSQVENNIGAYGAALRAAKATAANIAERPTPNGESARDQVLRRRAEKREIERAASREFSKQHAAEELEKLKKDSSYLFTLRPNALFPGLVPKKKEELITKKKIREATTEAQQASLIQERAAQLEKEVAESSAKMADQAKGQPIDEMRSAEDKEKLETAARLKEEAAKLKAKSEKRAKALKAKDQSDTTEPNQNPGE